MTTALNTGGAGDASASGWEWGRNGPAGPPDPGQDWQGIGPFGIGLFGDAVGLASHFWSDPPPAIGPFGDDPVGAASYFWSSPPPVSAIGPFGMQGDGWVV